MKTLDRLRLQYLIIHHSLSEDGKTLNWPAIVRWHVKNNHWSDVGYHVGIENVGAGNAVVSWGRPLQFVGSHCKEQSMNFRSWGLCVVGNYDDKVPPKCVWDASVQTAAILCLAGNIRISNILPHTDFAKYKSCPGRSFDMGKFRSDVEDFLFTKMPTIHPAR